MDPAGEKQTQDRNTVQALMKQIIYVINLHTESNSKLVTILRVLPIRFFINKLTDSLKIIIIKKKFLIRFCLSLTVFVFNLVILLTRQELNLNQNITRNLSTAHPRRRNMLTTVQAIVRGNLFFFIYIN